MEESPPTKTEKIFENLLLKLATRCNINCTYCYWFRDSSVYQKPGLLTATAEESLLSKLRSHIKRYDLKKFRIMYHGGEPLLFGKRRFEVLCGNLRRLEGTVGFSLRLTMTTNGLLIDEEWISLFKRYGVSVTLSIDGPARVHDSNRLDFKGEGTFNSTIAAFHLMRSEGLEPWILAVCNPAHDPEEICEFFTRELHAKSFDILVPDSNYEDKPASIATYYTKLFDLWYDKYSRQGVRIRFLESVTKGLLGMDSNSESIGYGPVTTVTMLTDGSLEPLDVLRTAGNASTKTEFNIVDNELQDIQGDPLWREVHEASLNLHETCQGCIYRHACGGGHIASRWSKTNRYNNPSVYCQDYQRLFSHAWTRISSDLYLEQDKVIAPKQS
jgi:uncharacterized protein